MRAYLCPQAKPDCSRVIRHGCDGRQGLRGEGPTETLESYGLMLGRGREGLMMRMLLMMLRKEGEGR